MDLISVVLVRARTRTYKTRAYSSCGPRIALYISELKFELGNFSLVFSLVVVAGEYVFSVREHSVAMSVFLLLLHSL